VTASLVERSLAVATESCRKTFFFFQPSSARRAREVPDFFFFATCDLGWLVKKIFLRAPPRSVGRSVGRRAQRAKNFGRATCRRIRNPKNLARHPMWRRRHPMSPTRAHAATQGKLCAQAAAVPAIRTHHHRHHRHASLCRSWFYFRLHLSFRARARVCV
jgi:hypothetical protein